MWSSPQPIPGVTSDSFEIQQDSSLKIAVVYFYITHQEVATSRNQSPTNKRNWMELVTYAPAKPLGGTPCFCLGDSQGMTNAFCWSSWSLSTHHGTINHWHGEVSTLGPCGCKLQYLISMNTINVRNQVVTGCSSAG